MTTEQQQATTNSGLNQSSVLKTTSGKHAFYLLASTVALVIAAGFVAWWILQQR
jgi:hypothetical protein